VWIKEVWTEAYQKKPVFLFTPTVFTDSIAREGRKWQK